MSVDERFPPQRVLAILVERIEKRISTLKAVRLDGFSIALHELTVVAEWLKRARSYVERNESPPPKR